jgi:hypothetical protein
MQQLLLCLQLAYWCSGHFNSRSSAFAAQARLKHCRRHKAGAFVIKVKLYMIFARSGSAFFYFLF